MPLQAVKRQSTNQQSAKQIQLSGLGLHPQADMPDMPNVFKPFTLINDPNPQTLEDDVSV